MRARPFDLEATSDPLTFLGPTSEPLHLLFSTLKSICTWLLYLSELFYLLDPRSPDCCEAMDSMVVNLQQVGAPKAGTTWVLICLMWQCIVQQLVFMPVCRS